MDIAILFPVIHEFDSFEKVDFNINVHGDYKFDENFEIFWNLKLWNFKKTEIFEIFWKFWNLLNILKSYENFEFFWNFWNLKIFLKFLKFENIFEIFEILKKKSVSDDNARGSRMSITVVCSISDVQLKIPRKLFKLPVNSSAAVNSLENYGPVNSLSVKIVKQ